MGYRRLSLDHERFDKLEGFPSLGGERGLVLHELMICWSWAMAPFTSTSMANGLALQIEANNCPSGKTTKTLEVTLKVTRNGQNAYPRPGQTHQP